MTKNRFAAVRRQLGISFGAAIALSVASAPVAHAAGYPERPVRIIVPYAPGGGSDAAARAIGQRLSEMLGQPFLVENKAGAATQLGTVAVAKAAPDGYTLLLGTANLATNPALFHKLPYDAQRDFAPISLITKAPVYILVNADAGITDLKTLVARARQSGQPLSFGNAGTGSIPHLAGELFAATSGIRLQHIPYKGSSEAVTALIGHQLDMTFDNLTPTAAMIKAGKLRALAVTSVRRSELMPGTPTTAELGVPIEASSWWGLLAPAGTPPEVIARLNKAMVTALATPEMAQRLATIGIEPYSCSPADFAAYIRSETSKWAQVVKQANIRLE
jgi:tripartite-type tricarboxylate transporter receptor subunit TctC